MPPLPRGTCPFCGAEVALRKGGLIREHKTPGGINVRGVCPGSGKPPPGDQLVTVTATVQVAVTEDREDAQQDALQLVGDAIGPHVHGLSDWGGRFAIVTRFDMTADRP